MNRRRLDVEAWRDAMLAVAGRLDATLGGPSVSLDAPESSPHRLRRDQPARPGLDAPPLRLPRPQHHQRRSRRDDRPAPAALRAQQRVHGRECQGRRRAIAGGLARPAGTTTTRIRQAYLLLYGRAATERELNLGLAYLRVAGTRGHDAHRAPRNRPSRWERYTQALLAANEFLFID